MTTGVTVQVAPIILIVVEDDPDVRDLLGAFLELKGYTVMLAVDGQDALQRLRESEKLPSLILLDLSMPVMDGIEFRAAQERDPRVAGIPIILMSANPEAREVGAELRAVAVLEKPIQTATLLMLVQQFCEPERVSRPAA